MNIAIIKNRQRWVLEHPALLLGDLRAEGYRRDFECGGGIIATVLSIDTFSPPVRWQSQVGVVRKAGTQAVALNLLSADALAALQGVAARMLEGVGIGADHVATDAQSLTLSRDLSPREQQGIAGIVRARAAATEANPIPIGELNIFDLADDGSRVGETEYIAQDRIFLGIHNGNVKHPF